MPHSAIDHHEVRKVGFEGRDRRHNRRGNDPPRSLHANTGIATRTGLSFVSST